MTDGYPPDSEGEGTGGGRSAVALAPERVGVADSARRHWKLIAIPVIVLMLIAVLIAWLRPPEYRAEARLAIGSTSLPSTSLSQAVVGAQSLAAAYSRLIDSQPVHDQAIQNLADFTAARDGILTATPIPEAPIIRVEATGGSAAEAIAFANAGSDALVGYIRGEGRNDRQAAALIDRVEQAVRDVRDAEALQSSRQAAFNADPTTEKSRALDGAVANLEGARLKLETARDVYRESQQGRTTSEDVQILNVAGAATSDRSSTLQQLVFIAVVGGLIIGVALAVLRANALRRRWLW